MLVHQNKSFFMRDDFLYGNVYPIRIHLYNFIKAVILSKKDFKPISTFFGIFRTFKNYCAHQIGVNNYFTLFSLLIE